MVLCLLLVIVVPEEEVVPETCKRIIAHTSRVTCSIEGINSSSSLA